MKARMKRVRGGSRRVGLVGGARGAALGEDAAAARAPDWSLAGYVDVQSDYKFRGISQNDREPSPQGSLTLSGPDGFYISTWASTIDFEAQSLIKMPCST